VPNADLILPGFYGKLPSAGDFVTRGLPHDFVQVWDRWLARHIAPLIGSGSWDTPLRFMSGEAAFGPAAGIITASRDRVGRLFPLTLVAMLPRASIDIAHRSDAWFAALEDAAAAASDGLSTDELEQRLTRLELMLEDDQDNEAVDGMIVWTARSDLYDLDPDQPLTVLKSLLAQRLEAS